MHAVWVGGGLGDCGITSDWACESIDGLGPYSTNVALATNSAGRAVVAYSRFEEPPGLDYFVNVTYSWIMRDGFETGDTSSWLATTSLR